MVAEAAGVQDLHVLAWHGICEVVEGAMVSARDLEKTARRRPSIAALGAAL